MINKLKIVLSESKDVFFNQAFEFFLFDAAEFGEAVLYLWTNERTVVIGRNQCARDECEIELLEKEGGKLARRLSGGGAVYHDEGNLNFTFAAKAADFDKNLNDAVILGALLDLGVKAELSGRNDVEVSGAKISGNAYYFDGGKKLHHGTLLISSSANEVAKYLKPPATKSRAVKSVVSRVGNLQSSVPDITKRAVTEALIASFIAEYEKRGNPLAPVTEISVMSEKDFGRDHEIFKLRERFENADWRYGTAVPHSKEITANVDGSTVKIKFNLSDGAPKDVEIDTDSMDFSLADTLKEEITRACLPSDGADAEVGVILKKMRELL